MSMHVGIEAMNVYGGSAFLDVSKLAKHRGLDSARFENLLMKQKTVALPCEDPVSFGASAAKPIIEALSPADKDRIELLITCTESGIDFAKSLSTYLHLHLGLNRNCRLFELKNACYSGSAGLQVAIQFVLSQTSPGAKALVVATDISRLFLGEGEAAGLKGDWAFTEPSGGSGAVAMLVSDCPYVFEADAGANGYYGYEVMDACRPFPDGDAGDADLSLLSYLDCLENAFLEYQKRVANADFTATFGYLAFHTPFGGMVKGAHRMMMRKHTQRAAAEIQADFERRVMPGMVYCQRVGNIMGASTALALAGAIDHGDFTEPRRVGCFSYGSGCCSEFYSGVVTAEGQRRLRQQGIARRLDQRHELSIEQYETILRGANAVRFGARNVQLDPEFLREARAAVSGTAGLYLTGIKDFHREYAWFPAGA
jgi:polyketide biosynthesis 3-hydroxy-3-methylglutaryl-CoA synthase-like enzyme PksG